MLKILSLAILAVTGTYFVSASQEVVPVKAADVKWKDHPSLKGGFLAVQSGDPAKGPSVLMMKFPKGYTIPPHTHTSDETVTFLSGSAVWGGSETIDLSKGIEVGPGSYVVIPGKAPHWLVIKEELIFTVALNHPADYHPCAEKK